MKLRLKNMKCEIEQTLLYIICDVSQNESWYCMYTMMYVDLGRSGGGLFTFIRIMNIRHVHSRLVCAETILLTPEWIMIGVLNHVHLGLTD
jgi:hypothetical protein